MQISTGNTQPKVRKQNGHEVSTILSGKQKKAIFREKRTKKYADHVPTTAQETLAFEEMFKDGICRVSEHYYTKCIQFGDTNYRLA